MVSLFHSIVLRGVIGFPILLLLTSQINRPPSTRTPLPITLAFLINGNGRQRSRPPSRERLKGLLQRHRVKWARNCSTIRGSDFKKINLSDAWFISITSTEVLLTPYNIHAEILNNYFNIFIFVECTKGGGLFQNIVYM